MTQQEKQEQALSRAQGNTSLTNYPAIYQGFAAKGIPENDIKPRFNVLTFNAWKALGRSVKRGEHGVRVLTFVEGTKEIELEDGTKEIKHWRAPKGTVVFHVSQTEER